MIALWQQVWYFTNIWKNDPIAVKDIRDLRFMGRIYRMQCSTKALRVTWDKPPQHLQSAILHRHRDDLRAMIMTSLHDEGQWQELEAHCRQTITETISQMRLVDDPSSGLEELHARRWELWSYLIASLQENHSVQE